MKSMPANYRIFEFILLIHGKYIYGQSLTNLITAGMKTFIYPTGVVNYRPIEKPNTETILWLAHHKTTNNYRL